MKKSHLSILGVFLFLSLSIISCQKKDKSVTAATEPVDVSYGAYVASFPAGTISNHSSLQITLVENITSNFKKAIELPKEWFTINPETDGKAYWTSAHTIIFKTEKPLKSNEKYTVSLQLGKLLKDIPAEQEKFSFSFNTIKQDFSVESEGLYSYNNAKTPIKKYKGYILTADYIENNDIEKTLVANYKGKQVNINWTHSPNGRQHNFTIDSIKRTKKTEFLEIQWNGKDIGIENKGERKIEIPAIGIFKVTNIIYQKSPEKHLEIQFSDILDKSQNFNGLIRVGNSSNLRFIVEGNILKAYPTTNYSGTATIRIEQGIKNSFQSPLDSAYEEDVVFEDIEPTIRFLGKGVITPSSKGLIVPFEAVGLNAVDVRIIEIFEKNIPQFLQKNSIDGNNELRRVGRLILSKKVELQKAKKINLKKWNAFTLDIAKLISVNPGAIYRVELRFRKSYSEYGCDGVDEDEDIAPTTEQDNFAEWDEPGWYSTYHYPENYRWEDRDNPCTNSYYNSTRFISRNIFSTNLALIAKSNDNNKITVAVSNIVTAQPESAVKLKLLNFQNQEMATATTGNNGFAEIQLDRKPYLLMAEKGNDRAYLRLADGHALSLSNFDIGGVKIQKGIKGFIYGERGVWRPGDNIFLAFILDDTEKNIPQNHPVIFELKNPQGQTVARKVNQNGKNGFYTFLTKTNDDAPTGRWTANISVGGVHFQKILKIETVKPNRLKVKLDFDKKILEPNNANQKVELSVKWLHGAIARNLKTDIKLMFGTQQTKFDGYPRFSFDDPAKSFYSEEQSIFNGKINNEGKASIVLNLKNNNTAPGMLNAFFTTKVFEEGGDFSIDMQKIPFAPYSSFVGMRMPEGKDGWYLTDTDHWIDIATVKTDGTAISANNLKVEVFKIEWRWWWDASDENLASYIKRSSTRKVFSTTTSTRNGKGRFKLNIPYHDWHDYGRYFIRITNTQSGHSTGNIVYFSKWYGRPPEGMPENATILSFTSDKKKYNVGETATIKIPSSKGGKALVSIEVGTQILKKLWIDTDERETEFSFDISQGMAPNAYISVMLIQPHSQTVNDHPIRMYGICPILVEDEDTKLYPQIKMNEVLTPEKDFSVKVSEKKGRSMTYTLAVVDEGLLDLTRFKTPAPWNSFYAREALGIKTWDLYDNVMGAYGARLESAFAIGGDENLSKRRATKANRFKPVVMFYGPFSIEKGETKTHNITMPNYVGSVRTMIVAGNNGAYGSAEKATPVRKPLMVLATLPRILGPSETVKLPVTIFAMEDNIKDVSLKVETNELLNIVGDKKKIIHFTKTGEQIVDFNLKVSSLIGMGKVKITAQTKSTKSTYNIEIAVRPSNPRITVLIDTVLKKDEQWKYNLPLPGIKGTNHATLEISSIPPVDFSKRLSYLIHYPHGCIEQTTSSVFPQLFLSKVVDLSPKQKSRIKENVQAGLSRLMKFQLANGGFSYWPGESSPSDWGTSYAGNFIIKAEEMGYNLPVGMKRAWVSFQKSKAQAWNSGQYRGGTYYANNPLLQAYRLYTLALAGEADLASMNRLREQKNITEIAMWRLAAAYQLAGQEKVANEIITNLQTNIKPSTSNYESYGSDTRDKAMILETLSLLKKQTKGFPLMKQIASKMSSDNWLSTQTTAYCLVAISEFIGTDKAKGIKVSYTNNSTGKKQIHSQKPIIQEPIEIENKKANISVKNENESMLYVRINMSGIPIIGSKYSSQKNIKMRIEYQDLKGESINIAKIKQGTDFKAVVTISNVGIYGNVKNIALTQIFPSGWEILNTRFGETANSQNTDVLTYQDIRDDRVYSYFDLDKNKTKSFTISLNATYAGRYYLPTVSCQAMYNNEVHAQIPGQWVEVVK